MKLGRTSCFCRDILCKPVCSEKDFIENAGESFGGILIHVSVQEKPLGDFNGRPERLNLKSFIIAPQVG